MKFFNNLFFLFLIGLFSVQLTWAIDKETSYSSHEEEDCYSSEEGCFSHPFWPERKKTLIFDEWAEVQASFEKPKRKRLKDVIEFEAEITKIIISGTTAEVITKTEEKIFLACEYWAYDGYGGYTYPAAILTPHTDTPVYAGSNSLYIPPGLEPLFYQKIETSDCKKFVDRAREELESCTSNENQMVMRVHFNAGLEIMSDCVSKGNTLVKEFFDRYKRKLDFYTTENI